jgi:hypothetical protein
MARESVEVVLARSLAAVRKSADRYGPEDIETMKARTGLALALGQDGQYAAAAREASEVVRVRTAVLGPTDPATIQAQRVLVGVLVRNGEWDRVAAVYPSIIQANLAVWGPRARNTLGSRVNYGISLRRSGRDAEGEAELRDALQICVDSLGDDDIVTKACRNALL